MDDIQPNVICILSTLHREPPDTLVDNPLYALISILECHLLLYVLLIEHTEQYPKYKGCLVSSYTHPQNISVYVSRKTTIASRWCELSSGRGGHAIGTPSVPCIL